MSDLTSKGGYVYIFFIKVKQLNSTTFIPPFLFYSIVQKIRISYNVRERRTADEKMSNQPSTFFFCKKTNRKEFSLGSTHPKANQTSFLSLNAKERGKVCWMMFTNSTPLFLRCRTVMSLLLGWNGFGSTWRDSSDTCILHQITSVEIEDDKLA